MKEKETKNFKNRNKKSTEEKEEEVEKNFILSSNL
jgi:hypothetical protein